MYLTSLVFVCMHCLFIGVFGTMLAINGMNIAIAAALGLNFIALGMQLVIVYGALSKL